MMAKPMKTLKLHYPMIQVFHKSRYALPNENWAINLTKLQSNDLKQTKNIKATLECPTDGRSKLYKIK